MRKDEQYRETKMRLLHRLVGIESLASSFNGEEGDDERHWFKGFHVYPSRETVLAKFQKGDPLSCFCLNEEDERALVHVAYKDQEKRDTTVSYLTFSYDISKVTNDTGIDFCPFTIEQEKNSVHAAASRVDKVKLQKNIVSYALMLPYKTKNGAGVSFQTYTLIYSDWEVLSSCSDLPANKGPVPVHESVFRHILDIQG